MGDGMTSTRTKTAIAALAAGAAAAAASALPATGQDTGASPQTQAQTLTFTSTQGRADEHDLDLGPHGPSVGDRFVLTSTLHRGGKVAGRIGGECTFVDRKYQGLSCALTAVLSDGTIAISGESLAKRIPGVSGPQERYAITGGTGAYAAATGTMTRSGSGKRDKVMLQLGG
jgi:hypothetical protein